QHPQVDLPLNSKGKLDVGGGIGAGLVSVTRFTGLKDPITGSCEIVTGEIAEDLTSYLYISEQTPSSVGLGVLVDTDLKAAAAGGFIIQPLPDASEETIAKLEENLGAIKPVSTMVHEGLDARGIIAELLKGFDIEYLTTTDLAFKCQCSRHRIEDMLVTLNKADLQSLIDDGHAEVCCHFCGEKYQFSKEELTALLHVAEKLK
ncbi:MAG TPA: Hsp33 family molecular chaperone HslO, partial [Megamonas hypermegale]|nr:Hsp33 family molecular chaperone HslO [Megamonas hypermegale]